MRPCVYILLLPATGLHLSGSVLVDNVAQEILYDNTSSQQSEFHARIEEYGDEVQLGGFSRLVTQFQFEYFGEFEADGDETGRLRFYANDGPGNPGFKKPGTLLYESPPFSLFPNFRTVTVPDIVVEVPSRFTWTVEFSGLSGALEDRAGLLLRDPPEVGSSFDDFWVRELNEWNPKRFGGEPRANFSAKIVGSVDLSITIASASLQPDGSISLVINGPPDRRIVLEASNDLTSWTPVDLLRFETPELEYVDSNIDGAAVRFYRARLISSEEVRLSGPRIRPEGGFEVIVSGPSGLRFLVQSSSDFQNWSNVTAFPFTFRSRPVTVVDSEFLENPRRFYRIVLSP